jgi:hypothetical protein
MKFVVIGCLCAGALAGIGCANGGGVPTGPSATAAVPSLTATAAGNGGTVPQVVAPSVAASPRSGDLQVTKECSGFTGSAGSFCTIKSSNVKAIEAESRILYLQPDQLLTPLGSDVILDPPGPGNNKAFGHCSLAVGVCTFSGGTGKFTSFHASVAVTHNDDFSLWYWEGTYAFSPQD